MMTEFGNRFSFRTYTISQIALELMFIKDTMKGSYVALQ